MRTICFFLGMTAIACKLQVGAALAFPALFARLPFDLSKAVSIAAAVAIGYILMVRPQVARRWQGPEWVPWSMAAAGAISILLGPLWQAESLSWHIGFRPSAVIGTIADIALLALFLKVAHETRPDAVSQQPADAPTVRLFLALWLVFSTAFVTPALANLWVGLANSTLQHALLDITSILAGQATRTSWVAWLGWIASAGLAVAVMGYGRIALRIPVDRPGVRLITTGLVIVALCGAPMFGFRDGGTAGFGSVLLALLAFALLIAPFAIIGHALVAIGLFRLLLNLEPEDGLAAGADAVAGEPPGAASLRSPPRAASAAAPPVTIASVGRQVAARPHDAVLHQQLHNLLLADPATGAELLTHAREYIALLVRQSRAEQAFAVLNSVLARDASFRPNADQVLPLANLATARGEGLVALRLMHEFDRRHPDHPATASVYYLSARVLRALNKFPLAAQILDVLLQRFPNDPIAAQARSLREALDRLSVAPK